MPTEFYFEIWYFNFAIRIVRNNEIETINISQ